MRQHIDLRATLGAVAIVLVMLPKSQLEAQVGVEFWSRDDGIGISRSVDALEKSREALLQARQALDAALVEVDLALETLRTSRLPQTLTERLPEGDSLPAGAPPCENAFSIRNGWTFLTGNIGNATTVFAERIEAWTTVLEELGDQVTSALKASTRPAAPAEPSPPQASPAAEVVQGFSGTAPETLAPATSPAENIGQQPFAPQPLSAEEGQGAPLPAVAQSAAPEDTARNNQGPAPAARDGETEKAANLPCPSATYEELPPYWLKGPLPWENGEKDPMPLPVPEASALEPAPPAQIQSTPECREKVTDPRDTTDATARQPGP